MNNKHLKQIQALNTSIFRTGTLRLILLFFFFKVRLIFQLGEGALIAEGGLLLESRSSRGETYKRRSKIEREL